MAEKKPESLADNLSSRPAYNPANHGAPQGKNAEELNKVKKKLEDFKKKVIKKFPFTRVLAILPQQVAPMFEEDEAVPKEVAETKPTHLIMIIPEEQFKNLQKIKTDVVSFVKESGENLWVHIKTSEVDLWNYGLDSKFEFIDAIASSFPLHDSGFLGSLRVASIHKNLVLNWLNVGRVRYVATYAIGGSLVRGTADKTSDVDTFVIIDDTDVKRMSRIELLEKLRGKIVGEFVREASAFAGVKNILNVQVYLLTDFWQSVKDAQPVMFTFIRDGIPLYDRGTFIPWKRLLQMGKIKPSPEAIDLYMKEGDRTEEIIKRRLMDAMIDVYYGVLTPTQAMMMLAGHAPPVPKTVVAEVKDALVDKEKVMTLKELKTLEKVVKLFKDYEHGKLKEISGKEIDTLVAEAKDYTKKMKELREKLEKKVQQRQAEKISEETLAVMKKIFGDKSQEQLLKDFDKELVKKGKISERMLAIAKELPKLKSKVASEKMKPSELHKISRDAFELTSTLMEYAQRKEMAEYDKSVLRVSFGEKKAEIILTGAGVFVILSDGRINKIEDKKVVFSDKKELDSALAKNEKSAKGFTSDLLEIIKKEFGEFVIDF